MVEELVLSDTDKLDWIKKEHTTIFAFRPLPRTDRAKSREPEAAQLTKGKQTGEDEKGETREEASHASLQRQQGSTQPQTQPQETTQMDRSKTANCLENPPLSGHQVFVRIPDTTHAFRIQHGGKILTHHRSLLAQGVRKGETVWIVVGGLFGGADTEMGDDPHLARSPATTPHRPAQTHSLETQCSIDEWVDRLRINDPLTQDLATVNMLMTALNLTKDQATTVIMEALHEGDEDKDTNISRFQQVQDAFPDNFEQFLEVNDIAFPTQHDDWEAFFNSLRNTWRG